MKDFITTVFAVIGIWAFIALIVVVGKIDQDIIPFVDGVRKSILYCILLVVSVVVNVLIPKDNQEDSKCLKI
jgi:uncharacterized membrane protein YhaH (DUF805 family)